MNTPHQGILVIGLMLRGSTGYLADRYSGRKERADKERVADIAVLTGAARE